MKKMRHPRLFHIFGLLCATLLWLANSTNPPNGNTGAPFNGSCSDCHSGNSNGYSGLVSVNGLPATIQPNIVYPLTITMEVTGGNPIRGGFQLVVVDGNNVNAGLLTPSNSQSGTDGLGGRTYLDHRSPKTFGGNPISWDFTWTAPANASGNTIKFYYVGNFVNNNGGIGGDYVVTQNDIIPFAGPPPVSATISSTTNVLCNAANTGSATVEPAGGNPPYTYHWNNNQSGQTATNLTAGVYLVTVTASGGTGTATATTTITQPTAITSSISVTGSLNCSVSSVPVSANTSGGVGPYTYAWSNGDTGNPVTYEVSGTQSVTITDANSCPKIVAFTVQNSAALPNAAAGSTATLSCLQPTATLNGSGSSTGASISYAWSSPDGGNIVSGGTTLTPVVNAAGTYIITVTNTTSGCTATASTSVTSSVAPPTASATGGQLTCANTSIVITATTNAAQAAYMWSGPSFTSTLPNPTVIQAGNYTVTVTNTANGCTKTATAVVTQNTTAPTVTATGGTISCTNPSVQLAITSNAPASGYSWSGPCIPANSQTLPNPAVTCAGTYTVTLTNTTNGCTNTASAVVIGNTTPPTALATPGGELTCTTSTVQVATTTNASPATYAWSGPNNFTATTPTISVQNAGNYVVTITSTANSCVATAVGTVVQNTTAPTASAQPSGPLTCTNTSVQVAATTNATATYAWAGPGGFTGTTQNISVQVPGTYTVTITSTANGCVGTASATVVQNTTLPTVSIATPGNLNCTATTIQINALASSQGNNFSYLWTTTNGHLVSGATTLVPTVNAAGTYNLLITNTETGCTASASTTVSQTPAVAASIPGQTAVSCNGGTNGSATALASGGTGVYTYTWSSGANTATAIGLSAGSYTVTTTDAAGCSATASVTIAQPALLVANAVSTAQTANGVNNGTATASPTGGTAPYAYLWSNAGTMATINGLPPGVYSVTVTDAQACTAVQTVTVNSFNCNLSAAVTATNIICNGAANGTATAVLTGGSLPITYLWSNGANTSSISGLSAGNYTVTMTDANGCPAVGSASITEPAILTANATATAITASNATDGTATAQPSGGTAPYTYIWSNGGTTPTITGLAPGTYSPTVTDANGCTAVQTVTVNAFNCTLAINISTTPTTCPESANGSATAVASGGSTPYAFVWSNGTNGATAENLLPGSYIVTVTDAASCISTTSVAIISLDTVAPTLSCPSSVSFCGADIFTFPLPIAVDNCAITAMPVLVSGQPSGSPFDDGVTTQVFTVTDVSGNSAICSFSVTVFPTPDVIIDATQNDIGNSGVGSISVSAVGGAGPYTFTWKKDNVFFSNSEDLTGLQAGLYSLSMVDLNGCEVVLAPITIDNTVGTNDPYLQAAIRVWPNPANTGIRLKTENITVFSAEILSAQGQLVQTIPPAELDDVIAVENLPVGIYYLKIVGTTGQTWVAKWIKGE